MADAITQQLGFDASGAIANIATTEKVLTKMNTRLRSLDATAIKFNSSGAQLATVLARSAPQATAAAVAINRLYSAASNVDKIARATAHPPTAWRINSPLPIAPLPSCAAA